MQVNGETVDINTWSCARNSHADDFDWPSKTIICTICLFCYLQTASRPFPSSHSGPSRCQRDADIERSQWLAKRILRQATAQSTGNENGRRATPDDTDRCSPSSRSYSPGACDRPASDDDSRGATSITTEDRLHRRPSRRKSSSADDSSKDPGHRNRNRTSSPSARVRQLSELQQLSSTRQRMLPGPVLLRRPVLYDRCGRCQRRMLSGRNVRKPGAILKSFIRIHSNCGCHCIVVYI